MTVAANKLQDDLSFALELAQTPGPHAKEMANTVEDEAAVAAAIVNDNSDRTDGPTASRSVHKLFDSDSDDSDDDESWEIDGGATGRTPTWLSYRGSSGSTDINDDTTGAAMAPGRRSLHSLFGGDGVDVGDASRLEINRGAAMFDVDGERTDWSQTGVQDPVQGGPAVQLKSSTHVSELPEPPPRQARLSNRRSRQSCWAITPALSVAACRL